MSSIFEKAPAQKYNFPPRMTKLLGLDGYNLPIGAFKDIRLGIGKKYDEWTHQILEDQSVIDALARAEAIVELGCAHEASMTRILAEIVRRSGSSVKKAVLLDIDPTVAADAIKNTRQAGIEEVDFVRLDLRSRAGLDKVKSLGGSRTVVAARALLNQLGPGATVVINQVFPEFNMGVVLDLAHPKDHPDAWIFSALDETDQEAVQAVSDANQLTENLYRLLSQDGRQLLGARMKTTLEEVGLNVVHHKVVPENPKQQPITDRAFADVPRLIATVVAHNLAKTTGALPVNAQEFDGQLTKYDGVLDLITTNRVGVTAIQFGGAVWNGKR